MQTTMQRIIHLATMAIKVPNGSFFTVFIILVTSFSSAAAAQANLTDPSDLTVLKSLESNLWLNMGDRDPCAGAGRGWPGVTCDHGTPLQHVTKIDLSGTTGIIATDFLSRIVRLRQLTSLSLAQCSLSGSIPAVLSTLPYLVTLNLSFNALSNSIPAQFGQFRALQMLLLNDNQLTGSFPKALCQVRSLSVMMLGNNNLQGRIPQCLGQLSNLTVLNIYNNKLTGSIPDMLPGQLPSLRELDLGFNNLAGSFPTSFTNFSSLEKLHLGANSLGGALPLDFHRMGKLMELYLDSNKFSGPIPVSICKLGNLTKLRLFNNQLNGSIPEDIGNLTQLTVLFLHVNHLSGSLPVSLGNLTLLQKLLLQGNRFSGHLDGGMFQTLKNVKSFYLHMNNFTGMIPLQTLFLSSLVNITLGFNNFTGAIPDPRNVTPQPQLARLAMFSLCFNNLTGRIPPDVGRLGNLRFLDLSNNQLSGIVPGSLSTLLNTTNVVSDLTFNALDITSWVNLQPPGGTTDPCLQRSKEAIFCQALGPLEGVAINAGGPQYTSLSSGTNYDPDNQYTAQMGYYEYYNSPRMPGHWVLSSHGVEGAGIEPSPSSTAAVAGSSTIEDSQLFQTARTGADLLTYSVRFLRPGEYNVVLSFAELDDEVQRAGQRVFDVYIQGQLRFPGLDVYNQTGGLFKPLVLRFSTFLLSGHGHIEVQLLGRGSWPVNEEKMMNYKGPIICALVVYRVHTSRHWIIILVVSLAAGILLILVLSLSFWFGCKAYLKRRRRDALISCTWNKVGLLSFTHAELESATNKFCAANLLGQGAFGKVYKGVMADGATIAIKQLLIPNRNTLESLQNELQVISTVRHRNLVPLIGCCLELECPILVCQYMPNGNLHDALFKETSSVDLTWAVRCTIAMDVARGLHYLHEESIHRIVHRDVKPVNILLDGMLRAHIADFGMARLLAEQEIEVITDVMGTRGYLAPEYALNGQLSDKVDVYSYGVVLLELVIGKRGMQTVIDSQDTVPLCQWAWQMFVAGDSERLVDKRLGSDYELDEFMIILQVAIWCTEYSQSLRPSMSQVLHMLTKKASIPPIPLERNHGYDDLPREMTRPFDSHSWESFSNTQGDRGPSPSLDDYSDSLPWNYSSFQGRGLGSYPAR